MNIQMRPDYINPLSTMTRTKQGYVLAKQYQTMLEKVTNTGISDKATALIKNSFEPFIEKFLDTLDAKIDENRVRVSKNVWQTGLIRTHYIDRDSVYSTFNE